MLYSNNCAYIYSLEYIYLPRYTKSRSSATCALRRICVFSSRICRAQSFESRRLVAVGSGWFFDLIPLLPSIHIDPPSCDRQVARRKCNFLGCLSKYAGCGDVLYNIYISKGGRAANFPGWPHVCLMCVEVEKIDE